MMKRKYGNTAVTIHVFGLAGRALLARLLDRRLLLCSAAFNPFRNAVMQYAVPFGGLTTPNSQPPKG